MIFKNDHIFAYFYISENYKRIADYMELYELETKRPQ